GGSKDLLECEFRRIVLARAKRYLLHGDENTKREASVLLQHSPYVQLRAPQLANYLSYYPAVPLKGVESFLYWSKETYAWRPMITITHVTILCGNGENSVPHVLVVSRDIFSTRYTSGSLNLTMLFRDPDSFSKQYLVYINRTWVDAMRALWRPFVEHRIRSQAKKVFADARARIEQSAWASRLSQ